MIDSSSYADVVVPDESSLSTKEYWREYYADELANFTENGDSGTVWFGKNSENTIVNYIKKSAMKTQKIVDLGCGNGSLLRILRKLGFSRLLGVDYCEDAIRLAKNVAETEVKEVNTNISICFKVLDLLNEDLEDSFDVVVDKGTWDAISLTADFDNRLNRYRNFLKKILQKNGIFFLVSCNYTLEELRKFFECDELQFVQNFSGDQFTFGGKKGSTWTGVVFKKSP